MKIQPLIVDPGSGKGSTADPANSATAAKSPERPGTDSGHVDVVAAAAESSQTQAKGSLPSPVVLFSRMLDRITTGSESADDVLKVAADLLRQQAATFVGRYRAAGRRIGEAERLDGLTAPADGLDQALRTRIIDCASAALSRGEQTTLNVDGVSIHAAVYQSNPKQVLVAVGGSGSGILPLLVSLVSSRISEKCLQDQIESVERGSRHAAALVELLSYLDRCRDVVDGAGRLSRELQRYLGAARVVTGYCDGDDVSCSLIADTAQDTINHHTEDTRLIQAMLEESVGRQAPSVWPPVDAENRHALIAHSQVAEACSGSAVVACPLTTEDGETIGAVGLVFGTDEPACESADGNGIEKTSSGIHDRSHVQQAYAFLRTASMPVAATLSLLDRSAPSLWQYIKRATHRRLTTQRLKTLSIVVASLGAVLLIPMSYRIDCDAELQPVSRRFVATPFDGTLKECLVRPGEYVEQGTVLALMDEREIQWELAGIQADRSRARKEQNSHLTQHSYTDAEIARHEVERLQHRFDLLQYRNENLELRSPIEGIVVSGDHEDEEGVPLKTGDTLFEVAPLDLMIIEVAVPEEDIQWVREGMPIRLQLEAMPAEVIDARVTRIHPRAELKDHNNVFLVEAEISNGDGVLRPGMRGNARIFSDRHTLGWNLFHKPSAWLMGWLGW